MTTFERLESEVRNHDRTFPVTFAHARGAELFDRDGRRYLDFSSGAGTLNYGHNNPVLKECLLEYLTRDGVVPSLDTITTAREELVETFESVVLRPRKLDYDVRFTGPTGESAVEAALQLARELTKRAAIVSFTNGFHGESLGALSVAGSRSKRSAAGPPPAHAFSLPYDGYLGATVDTLDLFERMLADDSSAFDVPAAVIVETTQVHGGVHVASTRWLQRLASLCRKHGILVIVDDVQVSCGRAGSFFSFERAGIVPDFVCLAGSLSGYGLPLAALLIRRDLDGRSPGGRGDAFHGFDAAFVTANAALTHFWSDASLVEAMRTTASLVASRLSRIASDFRAEDARVRGVGLVRGIALPRGAARAIRRRACALGLLVETAGPNDQVLTLRPPLNIDRAHLEEGLDVIERAALEVAARVASDGSLDEEAAE